MPIVSSARERWEWKRERELNSPAMHLRFRNKDREEWERGIQNPEAAVWGSRA